jgi:hypothetical protein
VKNNLENIDEVFKQAFDGYEANVDPSVWSNIQSSIGTSTASGTTAGVVGKSIALKIVAGVIAIGAVATGTYLAVDSGDSNNNLVAEFSPVIKKSEEKVINTLSEETELITENKEEKIIKEEFKDVIIKGTEEVLAIETSNNTPQVEVENTSTENNETHQNEVEESEITEVVPQPKTNVVNVNSTVEQSEEKPDAKVKPVEKTKPSEESLAESKTDKTTLVKDPNSAKLHKGKIPRKFSPNGDGIGDVLKIEGENIKEFKAVVLSIANGALVFEWDNLEGFWDGNDMLGNKVAVGTYLLRVTAIGEGGDPDVVQQTITVYR